MNRPLVPSLLLAVFFVLVFGVRTLQHWRTTKTTGFHGVSGSPGSAQWFGGVLFVAGIIAGVAAPFAARVGIAEDLVLSKPAWIDAVAIAIVVVGIVGTYWAQTAMGSSWRIGVRSDERTALVGRGPFRFVRNPIFTFMLTTAAGLVVLLPNALSIAAFATLVLAVELQVRSGEEPYLRRMHGDAYLAYCREVGRFLPGIGRATRA